VADAVVIGSRVIQAMEEAGPGQAVDAAASFVASIRTALDERAEKSVRRGGKS
jgi:tryptophan synthase alpha chain